MAGSGEMVQPRYTSRVSRRALQSMDAWVPHDPRFMAGVQLGLEEL